MLPSLLPLLQTFAVTCNMPTFLGLVPWYWYLNPQLVTITDPTGHPFTVCQIQDFTGGGSQVFGAHSPFLLIGLAILDDLIRVAALVAVGYIIYGGIQYITSQGSPDSTKKAQQTIINALIGVVTAITAASIVAFIGHSLGAHSR